MTSYFSLGHDCCLKRMETPCLYQRRRDELYELNEEAFAFLQACAAGEAEGDAAHPEFLTYCLEEGLLEETPAPRPNPWLPGAAPTPSLRYLEVQLTLRCNLSCRHCFLGQARAVELPWQAVLRAASELADMQGLGIVFSGGEPLLYSQFWELNQRLPGLPLRSVLVTNGTLLDRQVARWLNVDEVQVSLDGLRRGHEALRGPGIYDRTVRAIESLLEEGVTVSLATMLHQANRDELEEMSHLVERWGITQWNVDLPVATGRLAEDSPLRLSYEEAVPLMSYGCGGGHYTAAGDQVCGAHLACLDAQGNLSKCSFYPSSSGIPVELVGLAGAWAALPRPTLAQLKCNCTLLEECHGGCRYRASLCGDPLGPDPWACRRFGVA